eukprot:scaffold553420_cov31-Prasinocladus_malaysianus.AAC.1
MQAAASLESRRYEYKDVFHCAYRGIDVKYEQTLRMYTVGYRGGMAGTVSATRATTLTRTPKSVQSRA